jgi:uroporphyrinogen-III decarboxylase
LIWGSDIFVDLFDEPELVCDLLNSITEAYLDFMRAWREAAGWEEPLPGYSVHWGFLQKGQIMIRDDSAMNLSPEMFAEFIMPYDNRLLNELGGGMIHSCGRVDHWTKFLKDMPGLYGFNMSQPEYNDMEVVYRDTVDRMIPLVTLPENVARDAINSGRDLKGRVACW